MNNENKYRVLLTLLALLLISGWFYWYELRPAKIRQECSWVKTTGSMSRDYEVFQGLASKDELTNFRKASQKDYEFCLHDKGLD